MAIRVNAAEVFPKPGLCRFHGNVGHVELLLPYGRGRAVPDHQVHGHDHATSAKASLHLPCHQESLITIVVQDGAKPLHVGPRKGLGYPLHDRVADGIRMSEPLPLHDFDVKLRCGEATDWLNMDIVHVSQPARYPFSTSVATIRRAATSGASWSPRTITSGFSGGSYVDWIPGTVVASPCRAFW